MPRLIHVCAVAAVVAGAIGWMLGPEFVARHGSADGILSAHSIVWLERYRRVAWGVSCGFVAIGIVAGLARHRVLISRLDSALPRIVLGCASAAVACVLAEGIARAVEGSASRARGARDAAASAREFMRIVASQLNADGYRDESFDRPRVGAERRLLLIGDSFAFSFGVETKADTFAAKLEAELRSQVEIDVFNAAVCGADSERELTALRETLDRVEPDLVVITWYVNDAESETAKREYVEQSRLLPLISDVMLRHSALWRALEPPLVAKAISAGWKRSYVEHLRNLHDPPDGANWRQRAAFSRLVAESMENGRRSAVVLFPMVESLSDYPLRDVHEMVTRTATEASVPCFDLLPALSAIDERSLWVDRFDHHLNARGNALAARAVARFLHESQSLDSK